MRSPRLLRAAAARAWGLTFALLGGCGSSPDADDPAATTFSPAANAPSAAVTPAGLSPGAIKPAELCLAGANGLVPSTTSTCQSSDTLDDALDVIAMDRCSLGVDPKAALADTGFARGTFLAPALGHPLAFLSSARNVASALDAAMSGSSPVTTSLVLARSAYGTPAADCFSIAQGTLSDVLAARALIAPVDATKTKIALDAIPADLALALGPIVAAIADANAAVAAAIPADAASRMALESYANWVLWSAPSAPTAADLAIVSRNQPDALVRAAARLSLTIENANLARFRDHAVPSTTITTTIGDIVLRGPGADTDTPDAKRRPIILWLDTGGADTHTALAGSADKMQPVSVLLDLGGADHYSYAASDAGTATRLPSDASGRLSSGRTKSRTPRQGGAMFGIGLTFDFGKDGDSYQSLTYSQGAGVFGVGALYDEGGSDEYAAETLAQGAGILGVGLLIDRDGDDQHRLFTRGQGYGASNGVGMLVDDRGTDLYRADPGDKKLGGELLYASDLLGSDRVSVKANHSAVQGFGEGRRGLPSDSIASGGLGILRDRDGDDRYEAGEFAQGGALEEGAGLLIDSHGDDHYEALAYAQGAGIHRGFAALVDEAGDDSYNAQYPIQATSVGVGHDYGVGLLVDLGGEDAVHAPTLALGCGNANGVGVFVASGGKDMFAAATTASFGGSYAADVSNDRKKQPTVGVFVKAGGVGTYSVAGKTVTKASTTWKSSAKSEWLRGVGIDAPSGRASF